MNQRQRVILVVCGVVIAAMLAYPPYEIGGMAMGHHWLISNETAEVNVKQLYAQWIGVILIGYIAYLLAKEK